MAIRKQIILTDPIAEEEVTLFSSPETPDGQQVITIRTHKLEDIDLPVQDLIEALYDLVPEKFNLSGLNNYWPPGAKRVVEDNNLRSDRSNKPEGLDIDQEEWGYQDKRKLYLAWRSKKEGGYNLSKTNFLVGYFGKELSVKQMAKAQQLLDEAVDCFLSEWIRELEEPSESVLDLVQFFWGIKNRGPNQVMIAHRSALVLKELEKLKGDSDRSTKPADLQSALDQKQPKTKEYPEPTGFDFFRPQ